jgi:hypothetical protein
MVSGPEELLKGQMTASPIGVPGGPVVMPNGEILHQYPSWNHRLGGAANHCVEERKSL